MRKSLPLILLLAVALPASATDVKTHLSKGSPADVNYRAPGWGNPPANAQNLIFYGGDNNQFSPYTDGYANGNTLLVPNTTVYAAVTAPKNTRAVATGVLFQHIATQVDEIIFDPPTATYDIRTGVAEGKGGTDINSGSGPQTVSITYGEFGPIYATSVSFTKNLTPVGGTTYFVNESPQCTDSSNSTCMELQYFALNTTEQTNGINPKLQPSYEAFFNSAYFGYTWANVCDLVGGQSPLCEWQSWGIYGY